MTILLIGLDPWLDELEEDLPRLLPSVETKRCGSRFAVVCWLQRVCILLAEPPFACIVSVDDVTSIGIRRALFELHEAWPNMIRVVREPSDKPTTACTRLLALGLANEILPRDAGPARVAMRLSAWRGVR